MRLSRYLSEDQVLLALNTVSVYGDDPNPSTDELHRIQESVISEMAQLFESNGMVSNFKKLRSDLIARERRNSTATGLRVAFPHVRTNQARGFGIAIGRSPRGLPFAAADGELVQLFITMIAPPYDDKLFLRIEQSLAKALTKDRELFELIMSAETKGDVVRAFLKLV